MSFRVGTAPRTLLSASLRGMIACGIALGFGTSIVQAVPAAAHQDGPAKLEDLRERVEREVEAARERAAEADEGVHVVERTNVVVVVNSGGGWAEASARQTVRVRQNGTETVVEETSE